MRPEVVAHAVERTLSPSAGPVHLNAPFRDPLAPIADGGAAAAFASTIAWDRFFSHLLPPSPCVLSSEAPELARPLRGVVIAGPHLSADGRAHAEAVGALARRLGWPVLADGLSPVRNHASCVPHLVTRYDAILRTPAAAQELRPEAVVCLGEWPTSKVLRQWVEASAAPVTFVTQRPDNRDALHGPTRRFVREGALPGLKRVIQRTAACS